MSRADFELKLHSVAEWIANTRQNWTREEVFCEMIQDDFDMWGELDIAARVATEGQDGFMQEIQEVDKELS